MISVLKRVSIAIFSVFVALSISAQDKVLMTNGKILEGKVNAVNDDVISFSFPKGKKMKQIDLDSYRVFSILYKGSEEKVIYVYDTLQDNHYTVEEMRYFVYGQQDAWRGYKPVFPIVLGGLIGGIGAYVIGDAFPVIAVPFASYLTTMLLTRTEIDVATVRNKKYLESKAYVDGYTRISQAKKNRNALWGSLLGSAIGLSVAVLESSE